MKIVLEIIPSSFSKLISLNPVVQIDILIFFNLGARLEEGR